jgi:hypothetical protein
MVLLADGEADFESSSFDPTRDVHHRFTKDKVIHKL